MSLRLIVISRSSWPTPSPRPTIKFGLAGEIHYCFLRAATPPLAHFHFDEPAPETTRARARRKRMGRRTYANVYFTASIYFTSRLVNALGSARAPIDTRERETLPPPSPIFFFSCRQIACERREKEAPRIFAEAHLDHDATVRSQIRRSGGCILENVRVRGVVFSSLFLQQSFVTSTIAHAHG